MNPIVHRSWRSSRPSIIIRPNWDKPDIVIFDIDKEAAERWSQKESFYLRLLHQAWIYFGLIAIWLLGLSWVLLYPGKESSIIVLVFLYSMMLLMGFILRRILILTKKHANAKMMVHILSGNLEELEIPNEEKELE